MRLALVCIAAGTLLAARPAQAQEPVVIAAPSGEVAQAFQRLRPAIVRIEVQETGADAVSSVGSGFFATAGGHIVTNYHVVSSLVNEPDRHRAMATTATDTLPLEVLAVDAVNDLAVVRVPAPAPGLVLEPTAAPPAKGDRLLALGHPRDLGLSIVEGTYNGQVERKHTPRLHFTGPLNPGMSGGPAVSMDGRLVGVNVATMGEEVAFLVPAAEVAAILARVPSEPPPPDSLLAGIAAAVARHADTAVGNLFQAGTRTVRLGGFVVPSEPTRAFQCWGGTRDDADQPYEVVVHQCSTDESIFLSETLGAGLLSFRHDLVRGNSMGLLRLLTATENVFSQKAQFDGTARETTRFKCEASNVRTAQLAFRTELCARRFTRLPGLYEAVLRATPFGGDGERLVTTLTLSGMPFRLIRETAQRYLETISRPATEAQ